MCVVFIQVKKKSGFHSFTFISRSIQLYSSFFFNFFGLGKNVLFIDADIAVIKDFRTELSQVVANTDYIFQDDRDTDVVSEQQYFCTGFFWLRYI